LPFDHGRFALVVEPIDAAFPSDRKRLPVRAG
jgi:hypothetical protein